MSSESDKKGKKLLCKIFSLSLHHYNIVSINNLMLKLIRTILAAVVFLLITLLFLDFTGTLHTYLGFLAKIQFLPAVLALNFVVVAALVVLTLVFGRIYCSVICPLGVMQDIIAHGIKRKQNRYSYSKPKTWLRYAVLALFIVALIAGVGSAVALLAPYSSYGRMAQTMLQPAYIWVNNQLAYVAASLDSYMFYEREVWIRSTSTLVVAAVTFVIIAILAWRNGRTYCNTICPVGTVLGFLSRFSWLKIVIDADKCKNCHRCERNCKASCIDLSTHSVDYSRCVTCGNCLGECKFGSIRYAHAVAPRKEDPKVAAPQGASGRREFLVGAGLALTGAVIAQEKKKVDGGLAVIEDKIQPERHTPLTPAGSLSAKNLQQHCTGCQLCVSECPNDVLRPSSDLMTLMQPTMSYERGYCRPECNACASVCPTGAIRPITLADKSSIQIGHAVWIKKNCIAVTEEINCGNCARHCPAGAITMVHIDDDESKPMVPAVNESRCIGCGACENLCPARPFSAIYVEGHEVHQLV